MSARGNSLHPAAWIVWATCAGMAAFTTTNPFYLGLVIAISWFVFATNRPDGPEARSFRIFLMFAAITVALRTTLVIFGTIDASNIVYAALEGLRIATLLIVFGAFNSVTDPFGVLRLAPRRFHEPALAAALALSIAPRTITAAGRVREAQQLRGIRVTGLRSLPALAVPVLETGMEDAVTLAESMDARGHGRGRRTRYRPERWSGAAVAVAATAAAGMFIYFAAAFTERGDLQPSTDPLHWPQVSTALVLAALLFALPGIVGGKARAP